MYNPLAYYSPNNYGYGYTPPNAGYGYGQGTGTGTGNGFFHMPGAPIPTPAIPSVAPQIYYPQPQHGGRSTAEEGFGPGEFSPTSQQAYNMSTLGRNLGYISPFIGAGFSAYGDYLARNVDPNYGHEAMRTPALSNPDYSNEGRTQFSPSEAAGAAMQAQQAQQAANSPIAPGFNYFGLDNQTAPTANSPIAPGFNYFGLDNQTAPTVPSVDYSNEGRTQYSPSEAVGAAMQAQQAAAEAAANYSNEGRTQYSPSEAVGAAMQAQQAQQAAANYSNEDRNSPAPESHDSIGSEHEGAQDRDSGGGGEKKGGVIRRKKQKSNFADGGIVDLVRQYPWLLR
jgi:hypothetical protein